MINACQVLSTNPCFMVQSEVLVIFACWTTTTMTLNYVMWFSHLTNLCFFLATNPYTLIDISSFYKKFNVTLFGFSPFLVWIRNTIMKIKLWVSFLFFVTSLQTRLNEFLWKWSCRVIGSGANSSMIFFFYYMKIYGHQFGGSRTKNTNVNHWSKCRVF